MEKAQTVHSSISLPGAPTPLSTFWGATRVINLLLRVFALGIIVFIVLTYVPTIELSNTVKLMIAALVVVTYSALDLMGASLTKTKDTMCDVLC